MADPPPGFLSFHPVRGRETSPTGSTGASQQPGPSKPTYSKRGKITIVACVPCRKRKTKCDGRRPTCSQCQSRDGQCHYDMNEEQRRLTFLRENVETLAEEKNSLEAVLWHLRNSTDDESSEILRRIRSGADPQSLVQQIQASRSLTRVKGDNPFFAGSSLPSTTYGVSRESYERLVQAIATASPAETETIVQRIRRHEPVERILDSSVSIGSSRSPSGMDLDTPNEPMHPFFHARPLTGNPLAPPLTPSGLPRGNQAPDAHTPPDPDDQHWTQVTEDKEFIEHLLDIYFTWQHTFFQNFPEQLFRQDYNTARTQYCSRVLVNALCAAGCLLSDRPEARGDPNDPSTAGAGFFEEGMRLLNQTDRSSIPTTAGIFILSHVEGYRARLSAMWALVGRSARMALDLGLHLRTDKQSPDGKTDEEKKSEAAKIHAFWGCFVSDQVTSLSIGRLPQLLTNSITVDLPPVTEQEDEEPWGSKHSPVFKRPGARATAFRQCAALSKLVNSTLLMFFAPSQIIKGQLLLDEYHKYLRWYQGLPTLVASIDNVPPHVLSLHMYYHAAVLLLFRPFLRAKFTESDIVPSDICRQSATAISDIFAKHLSLYDTLGIYTFQIQCLLAACTIHLINLPSIAATSQLRTACESFHKLVSRNTWALGSLKLIRDLVARWNIILPGDVDEVLYRSHFELPASLRERFEDPAAPQAEAIRGAKRAAFLNPSSQVMQKRQRLAPVQSSSTTQSVGIGSSGGAGTPATSSAMGMGKDDVQQRANQNNFLFAPFPNQPVPLLGPIHTSTTAESEWTEEMSRVAQDFDGLKFEGDGWFDPFIGI